MKKLGTDYQIKQVNKNQKIIYYPKHHYPNLNAWNKKGEWSLYVGEYLFNHDKLVKITYGSGYP